MLPVSPQTEFMFTVIYYGLQHNCFKALIQLNTDYDQKEVAVLTQNQ